MREVMCGSNQGATLTKGADHLDLMSREHRVNYDKAQIATEQNLVGDVIPARRYHVRGNNPVRLFHLQPQGMSTLEVGR